MTIGELARAAGLGVETIRFYQRRGLIGTPARIGAGLTQGVRRYDAAHLRALRFIRSAQAAGFTLEEIGELLRLDATHDRPRVRALAADRLAALDRRIAELEAARTALRRLAKACAVSEDGPCPILTAFD